MVASASSSKTKWPSGRWSAQSAFAAEAMDLSSAPISAFRWVFGLAALISRSCITVYPREIGGLVARPDRALDGGREARRRPVAGEKEIAPRCLGLRPFRVLI